MSDESDQVMTKTLKEIFEGPDSQLLQVVFMLSKEARRRTTAKMKDPAYQNQVQAGLRQIFGLKDQDSKP